MPEKVIHEIRLNQYSPQHAGGNRLQLGTSHSYGIERLHLIPEDGWDGLAVTATFHSPAGLAVRMLMGTDGMVDVPPEATASAGLGKIVISGVADDVQRISCNLTYMVMEHAHTFGGTSTGPTPDVLSQVLASTLEDRKAAAASAQQAEDAASAASGSALAADNSANTASAKAGDAATSATEAASSATAAKSSDTAAAKSAQVASSAETAAKEAQNAAETAKTGADTAASNASEKAAAAASSAAAAKSSETAAAKSARAAAESEAGSKSHADNAASSASAASTKADEAASNATQAGQSAANAASSATQAGQSAASAASSASTAAKSEKNASASASRAAESAGEAAKSLSASEESAAAAAKSAEQATQDEAKLSSAVSAAETAQSKAETAQSKAEAAAASAAEYAGLSKGTWYGVNFSGSTPAGTRTGAAKDFVFTPGTDTSAGQNSFDAVYPWAGMRRCCCTLNADGTVKVNAYKGQPGYIEDGTNGEVLVEIPLFYVSGMLDVAPSISMLPLPGFRAPRKFLNGDGSLKQKCYVRAFPGSIGADGKLHSIAGAAPTGYLSITRFLNAARQWGDTYSIGTSADFEVLAYLMVVVYGTRHVQGKINGCVSLQGTNIAVAAATDNAASVVVAKNAGIEPGMVISIGTGGEDETIAKHRIVTSVEAIDGDATNVKVNFGGDPVTTTTDHKVWRIMQSTGTANSVIATCGSPVSNTDGRHSFVFYGVENPLYGNQWRCECDWKLIDGVPYWCDDPTKYSWTSNDGYIALDTMAMPDDGWGTALQQDDRVPSMQITKSVGGSSGTYLADHFYINKAGTRRVLRGGASDLGGPAGPFALYLKGSADSGWWATGGDLSIPG